jgi:hypothetical protein
MKKKAPKRKRSFWRTARRVFRWCRITVWLAVLGLLVLAIWLNRVGLPDFIKDPLVSELRLRGVDLRFTRMRLVWYRGIVAENIQFGRPGETNGPRASATEAEVHLRMRPLLRRQIDVEGVALRGGRVLIPIWGTNDTPQELVIQKLNGELKFLPGDQWNLSQFQAETFGVKLRLDGTVTNASAIRSWKIPRMKPKEKTPEAFWHDLISQFEQTQFKPPTEIVGRISGDARRLETFRVNVMISSPDIDSPWGKGKNLNLSAQIEPQPKSLIQMAVKLHAEDADTRWGRAESVELETRITPSMTQWTPTNAHIELMVKRPRTPWGSASALEMKADFRPNPSDPASALATHSIRGQQVQTKWARLAQVELSAESVLSASNGWPSTAKAKLKFAGGEIDAGRAASGDIEASFTLPSWEAMEILDTNLTWWARLEKVSGDVAAQLTGVHTPKVDVTKVSLNTTWQPPLLTVRDLAAVLYEGTVQGAATLNTVTRNLSAEVKSDFVPHKVSPLLTTNSQRWLGQFTFDTPPKVSATARVTLPAWTNSSGWKEVNWRKEVVPTLSLAGHFETGGATFRTLPVNASRSDFSYTNRTWHLPNLLLTRPDGRAHIAHIAREERQEFEFVIDSDIDPRVLRPLFARSVQRVMDDLTLTTPPLIHAELAGQWHAPEKMSARATIALTNGGYRERAVLSCRSLVTFTNQVLSFIAPEVIRTEGIGRADSVVIDIPKLKLFINNAAGSLEVAAVTHVISPSVERTMEPYRFLQAPQASANGFVDLKDGTRSNLRFSANGGPFEWRSFRFQRITGDVDWAGTSLTFSNVSGSTHGGGLEMSAAFEFTTNKGANFAFRTLARDVDLHSLMSDLVSPTNKLEGKLSGQLVIANANSDDALSWFGYGSAALQDGLIWDVPALGLFSPILNAIKPGSGNSRAREVSSVFVITNSVIFTDELVIHASGMRLHYDGTIDFAGRINGRMEAELLRDIPGLGPLVSKVLWPVTKLFEYKVAGTLGKAKSQPVFIPKIIMMPFHPLRTLRELMEEDREVAPPKLVLPTE